MSDSATNTLAGLLHLGRLARQAENLPTLGFVMVNETRRILTGRQAALWRTPRDPLSELAGAGVISVSGLPEPDINAPYPQWLSSLFRHVLTPFPAAPLTLTAAQVPEAVAREWGDWLPENVLLVPLSVRGQPQGALLIARETDWQEGELGVAAELADIYAHAIAAFGARSNWRDWLRARLANRRRLTMIGLGVVVVCSVPVRLSVLAPAEVTPVEPFVVRAPMEGTVERFRIRPNQEVKAGDPLFDMDTTAARSRQEVARKSFDAAAEEYRQTAQLALTEDKGRQELSSRQAQLEEKRVEMEFSKDMLARVLVKAPRDGVAVFSDENEWQGKAVSTGERVLTLADPGKVEITVHLPVADAITLAPDAAAVFYANGTAFASFDVVVTSIAYRAEPSQEGVLSYRLKGRLTEGQAPPRLGAVGTAKVYGSWVPLIYHVLRRPLIALRQWLGM